MENKVDSYGFYGTYYGHHVHYLNNILKCCRKLKYDGIVYFAGDSSLDNKHWLKKPGSMSFLKEKAVNGYENILDPPKMVGDVAYHVNKVLSERNINKLALNCAVEESTLGCRSDKLLIQDEFIRDNINKNDTLVVSVGGNDIALRPSLKTMWNMVLLMKCNSLKTIKKGPKYCWGMNYFIQMFKDKTEKFIKKIITHKQIKRVIVCMIYFPDEKQTGSWADKTLGFLGYNDNPVKLQEVIKQIYIHATRKISIEDVDIVPFPMFNVLDGKNSKDYIARVEPSSQGGLKLAEILVPYLR